MPTYHFDVVDGYRLEDPIGLDCSNENDARDKARRMARQIAIDLKSEKARDVVVVDEDGKELFKAPVKP